MIAAALLFAILAGGASWWLWPEEHAIDKRGIAVLPFADLAGSESTSRLAEGITEDIITDLSRFKDLDVIARNSTAVYKGKPTDVREVGKTLGVRYVLEGLKARKRGCSHSVVLRMGASLIRGPRIRADAGTPVTCMGYIIDISR